MSVRTTPDEMWAVIQRSGTRLLAGIILKQHFMLSPTPTGNIKVHGFFFMDPGATANITHYKFYLYLSFSVIYFIK